MEGTFGDIPQRNSDKKLLYDFNRGGAGHYWHGAYEYRDHTFVEIAELYTDFITIDETHDEYRTEYTVIDEYGNQKKYQEELPKEWAEFWDM